MTERSPVTDVFGFSMSFLHVSSRKQGMVVVFSLSAAIADVDRENTPPILLPVRAIDFLLLDNFPVRRRAFTN